MIMLDEIIDNERWFRKLRHSIKFSYMWSFDFENVNVTFEECPLLKLHNMTNGDDAKEEIMILITDLKTETWKIMICVHSVNCHRVKPISFSFSMFREKQEEGIKLMMQQFFVFGHFQKVHRNESEIFDVNCMGA